MNEVVQADPDLNQWFLATPRWAVGLSPKKWRMEMFLASDESSFMTRLLLGLDGTVDRSSSLAWYSCVPLKSSRSLMKATLVKRLFAATGNQ